LVLMKNNIWEFSNSIVVPPTDPKDLAVHKLKDMKSRRSILDKVENHLIPHLPRKNSTRDMWEALMSLFQSKNENHKIMLREKLKDTKMTGSDTVTTYFTQIRQVRDELAAIGETVVDSELVRTTLKGFTKEWTLSIKGIMAQEKFPNWSRLWDDFAQEELQDEDLNGGRYKNDDEYIVLTSQAKKGKFKKFSSAESTSQDVKKKDMIKGKCYACREFGNYASQCPNKKKGGNETQPEVATSTKAQGDEFSKKFEQTEFLLVSQTSLGTISIGAWLIDSEATCHMTGARESFESFTELESEVHVELGMGTKHALKGSRTMSFRMESRRMLKVMDVLWVPKLRRSVLSVLAIEKKGYDLLF